MINVSHKYQGGCLCEVIRYEITAAIEKIVYCHCQRCRKASGSAFAAVAPVSRSDFLMTQGQEYLKSYSSPTGVHRAFSGQSGSPIIGYRESDPDTVRVRIGTLDTPLEAKLGAHIFVASKAEWYDIHDDAPQYTERHT